MFIRWERDKLYDWGYKVIDEEFEDIIIFQARDESIWPSLVKLYEDRNLPVVPNLTKAIIWWAEPTSGSHASIDEIIKHCKTQKFWKTYEEEISKYLILL
jgi:hypothetical protein